MSVNLPSKVKGFRADVINGIIDYLKSITPKQSAEVEPTVNYDGTTFKLKPTAKPFSVKTDQERDTGMVPVLREWRMNEDTKKAELVPSDEETIHDGTVDDDEKNPVIPTWGYPDSFPEDFGIKSMSGVNVIGPEIVIYGGEIQVGETAYTCTDTTLTVSTAEAYIGWDYSFDSETLTIVNFGETFARDPAHIRKWLYKVKRYTQTIEGTVYWRLRVIRRGRLNEIFPANIG